ncbi:MAG: hypothetical protein ACFFCW_40530 [Candidatus Hodarchaeota archaeon]
MKTINVTFEDKKYEELIKKKGEKTWHDFIIDNAKDEKQNRGGFGNTT